VAKQGSVKAGREIVPAPKGNQYGKGNRNAGKKSLYRPQYARDAKAMCERGATNGDLAHFFNVTVKTIRQWRLQYEAFGTAVKIGKAVADERVEQALYERAIGYDYDVDIGRGKSVVKHVPPDIAAMKVWLFNRRPDRWKDLQKSDLPAVPRMADLSTEQIKRFLVQKMIEWNLVPIENVPPELLAPIDDTVDDD
jgi:hypothetical protein